MKSNRKRLAKIWREFELAYDANPCDWDDQKKMIQGLVAKEFPKVKFKWSIIWEKFNKWLDTCPYCYTYVPNQNMHSDWDGEDGQEAFLQELLEKALKS